MNEGIAKEIAQELIGREQIGDFDEAGVPIRQVRLQRAFTLTLEGANPPSMTCVVDWVRELEERTPSREEEP